MSYLDRTVTINKETYVEIARYSKTTGDKIVPLFAVAGFAIAVRGIFIQDTLIIVIGLLGGVINTLTLIKTRHVIKRELRQNRELFGVEEFAHITSFMDDRIKIYVPQTDAKMFVNYSDINRFVETPNFYVLISKAKIHVIADKTNLIREQKSEAFICFLKEKCVNVKWRKR